MYSLTRFDCIVHQIASNSTDISIHVTMYCMCWELKDVQNGNKTLRSLPQQWLILRYGYKLGQFDVSCRNTEAKLAHMTDTSL